MINLVVMDTNVLGLMVKYISNKIIYYIIYVFVKKKKEFCMF